VEEGDRLLGQVLTLGAGDYGMSEDAGETALGGRGQLALTADEDEFALALEFAFRWASRGLVPYDDIAPEPTTGLQGVGHGRELPPVREHHADAAGFSDPARFGKPESCPSDERALVAVVAREVGELLLNV